MIKQMGFPGYFLIVADFVSGQIAKYPGWPRPWVGGWVFVGLGFVDNRS